jgi:uncharacterized protein
LVDPAADAYERELLAFRAAREAKYRSDAGWLTLVERISLEPGVNQTPLGALSVRDGGLVSLEVAPGLAVARAGGDGQLSERPDRPERIDAQVPGPGIPGQPVVFVSGPRRYEIVRRAGRLVMRVRDPMSPARAAFEGIAAYPIDPAYRVLAAFERLAEPQTTAVEMSDGDEDSAPLLGEARFGLPGQPARFALQIFLEESSSRLYVPFGDRTNRSETYGGGRFLYAVERDGSLVIDFNRACNPPCAFNPMVTCPLPPPANRLDVPIRAGERLPRGN